MGLSTRQDLATAVSAVDGVNGAVKPPKTYATGAAWPRWTGLAREDRSIVHTWVVRILIPDTDPAQQQWVDEHLEALLDAVGPHIYVDEVRLAALDDDTPVLEIEGRE